MRVTVEAQEDFLERLSGRGRPATAIAELIWNGLDADADRISIGIRRNLLGVIESIRVADDGHGMTLSQAEEAFSHLGGSWKQKREKTLERRRLLHGKDGKGRFRAFGLGGRVTWTSISGGEDARELVTVSGSAEDLRHFEISDPIPTVESRGTVVEVIEVWDDVPELESDRIREELAEVLALYLREYPAVQIVYLDQLIDPDFLEGRVSTVELDPVVIDGEVVDDVAITIVEWSEPTSRSL